MSDDLVERVAAAIWMADAEPIDPSDRTPFQETWEHEKAQRRAEARAAIALALEEAARVCDPKGQCSEMDAYGKAYAADIRAMIPKEKA